LGLPICTVIAFNKTGRVDGKAGQVTTQLDSTKRGAKTPYEHDRWDWLYRVGRVVLVAGLLGSFFFLAQSMVEHRFFEGGRYHANGSVGQ
jgi:hypothetical protein